MSERTVIVDGLRSPFIRSGTKFRQVPAWELGRAVTRELLTRNDFDPNEIDEVVFGCVCQPADSANIARVIALRSGIPRRVPAMTVGRNCASGLEAITLATERIASGRAQVVVAGGVESMSRIPLEFPESYMVKINSLMSARGIGEKMIAASSFRLRDFKPVIALLKGLTDPTCGEIMGLTGERLAREFDISRQTQDEFALESHQRAVSARDFLAGEIQPLPVPPDLSDMVVADNGPREGQSIESLKKLRPYFDRRLGTVTIGNSCPITDGAVALLMMSEKRAAELGYEPLGFVLGHAYRGCDPQRMGLGPVYATPPALEDAGIRFGELRRIELNEAFAAQVLACREAFASPEFARANGWREPIGEIDPGILNVNGGAIALGHPVGATGSRLVLTLLRDLAANGGGYGLATLCIGGGQGGAIVVEGRAA